MIRSVTVYCSSSKEIAPDYFDAGADLGAAIACAGWTLVYGGNRIGLMASVADAARAAGGKVVGVTPQLMLDHGMGDEQCDELIVTPGMRERKALLEQRGDAFVALPGGLGTLEELFEVLVAKLLSYHDKPIVLLNTRGYFNRLLAAIEHGIAEHFVKPRARQAWHVADDVPDAMAYLRSAPPPAPASPKDSGIKEPSATE